jgi:chloramphenicol-sensitive protein RarD
VTGARREGMVGAIYATAAFGFWGLAPIYWRATGFVPPLEMVAHRVLWAMPVMMMLVAWRGRMGEVGAALRDPRHRTLLATTALLISLNWLVFVWAVTTGHVLESSLGYFMNPLVNVALGYVFLGERLRRLQAVAVGLAAAGVLWLAASHPDGLWSALFLAVSFALYGLLRKRAGVDALVGLSIETVFLAPIAAVYVAVLFARGESASLSRGAGGATLVFLAGLVTTLPLLWFANAARRLRFGTLGFFQYLAPTGQFFLAVFAYGETFTVSHAVTFGLIWIAIALYLVEAVRTARAVAPPE